MRSSGWRIGWGRRDVAARPRPGPTPPTGALTPETLTAAVAACLPDGAVVVDEGATTTLGYLAQAAAAPRHTVLGHVGGAIGQGIPVAVGAAIAAPDRPVIALQADGSGLYTVQALWTQAREDLDITTVVCANHGYRILQFELARAGQEQLGPAAAAPDRPRRSPHRLGPPRPGLRRAGQAGHLRRRAHRRHWSGRWPSPDPTCSRRLVTSVPSKTAMSGPASTRISVSSTAHPASGVVRLRSVTHGRGGGVSLAR